jgi:hypothetical protein
VGFDLEELSSPIQDTAGLGRHQGIVSLWISAASCFWHARLPAVSISRSRAVRSDEDKSGAPRASLRQGAAKAARSRSRCGSTHVSKTKRLTTGVAQAAPDEIVETVEVRALSSMFIRARLTGTILGGTPEHFLAKRSLAGWRTVDREGRSGSRRPGTRLAGYGFANRRP